MQTLEEGLLAKDERAVKVVGGGTVGLQQGRSQTKIQEHPDQIFFFQALLQLT